MRWILLMSLSLLLFSEIVTPSCVFSTNKTLEPKMKMDEQEEPNKDLFLQQILCMNRLMGASRDNPSIKELGIPSIIEMSGYCYSYPNQWLKIGFDDLEEVSYVSLDYHPSVTQLSYKDVEEWLGKPYQTSIEEEGTYSLFKIAGHSISCPCLLLFKNGYLCSISLFPRNF